MCCIKLLSCKFCHVEGILEERNLRILNFSVCFFCKIKTKWDLKTSRLNVLNFIDSNIGPHYLKRFCCGCNKRLLNKPHTIVHLDCKGKNIEPELSEILFHSCIPLFIQQIHICRHSCRQEVQQAYSILKAERKEVLE